jgi:protein ImuB
VNARRPHTPLVETLEFPEAVGQELTLRRGLGVLVDGLLARPERAGRPPRKLALWARLVGGASWRRVVTLREPTADPERLRLALGPKLAELPAPVLKLRLEAMELATSDGEQLELVRAEGEVVQGRLKEGLRQVKAAVGAGGVSMVVEVAPWSRIPEARALFVPRDD